MNQQLWEEIRTNWVNGNRQDAKDQLYNLRKNRMLGVILEALRLHYAELKDGDSTYMGDLNDLIEILNAITKGKL